MLGLAEGRPLSSQKTIGKSDRLLAWIMTKNIWVSTGAHIVNDWLLFSMTLLGAMMVN
jgi:hypothetical protein